MVQPPKSPTVCHFEMSHWTLNWRELKTLAELIHLCLCYICPCFSGSSWASRRNWQQGKTKKKKIQNLFLSRRMNSCHSAYSDRVTEDSQVRLGQQETGWVMIWEWFGQICIECVCVGFCVIHKKYLKRSSLLFLSSMKCIYILWKYLN